MGTVVLNGATSGATTLTPVDTVTATITLPSATSTLVGITAAGTANKAVFYNAAGTAPEWATGNKIGLFTRDISTATGTQAVTGVGFKPSAVVFFASKDASTGFSVGVDDQSTTHGTIFADSTTGGVFNNNTALSIALTFTAGAQYTGVVQSFDSDGFTISWTKAGSPTGTARIWYLALR